MEPLTVFFVRHGYSEKNRLDILNGDPNRVYPLTPEGEEQAREVGSRLAGEPIDRVFTSEFTRAIQTARIINEPHGAPTAIDPRLNETWDGVFEGKTLAEYNAYVQGDRIARVPPGAETIGHIRQRMRAFLDDLSRQDCRAALVVSHGTPIKIVRGILEGLDDGVAISMPLRNCEVLRYTLQRTP